MKFGMTAIAMLMCVGVGATPTFYQGVSGGGGFWGNQSRSWGDVCHDPGFGLGVKVGVQSGWRIEIEGLSQGHQIRCYSPSRHSLLADEMDSFASQWLLMANGGFSFGTPFRVRPYVLGGIGAAFVQYRFANTDSTADLAVQGIAGLEVPISRSDALGVQYRMVYIRELKMRVQGAELVLTHSF